MFKPLHTLVSSGRNAEHPVCHDGVRFVHWHEFERRIQARACALMDRHESRWLITSNDPYEFSISLLGLLHAGKQVVIPPNSQPGTVSRMLSAFDATVDGPTWTESESPTAKLAPIDPHTAIVNIYTSGSTGEPKQIRKTLAQFETEVGVLESLWGHALGHATVVASAPHHHFYGLLFRLFWPLSAGRPFDSVSCVDPDTLAERLLLLSDTALVSSPALLSRLPELVALTSLQPAPRMIFSSGGPLPACAAAEFHRQLGWAPTEVFGSTETGGIAWRRQEGSDSWTTMPGIQINSAFDGALLLRSPYLLDASPWRMDDAVDLLPDGRFTLRGRLDRVVKIEEKRLSLPDMEARLCAHPWVAAAAAVALTEGRQIIGAVVVLNAVGLQALANEDRRKVSLILRQHLADYFEPVVLPRRWRFPKQLPINERGKVTPALLTELFANIKNEPFSP